MECKKEEKSRSNCSVLDTMTAQHDGMSNKIYGLGSDDGRLDENRHTKVYIVVNNFPCYYLAITFSCLWLQFVSCHFVMLFLVFTTIEAIKSLIFFHFLTCF